MSKRIVPGSDITPVVFPNVPPENNIGNYFESKIQDEHVWQYPDWDVCRPEPNMDLIFARREFLHADKELVIKRENYVNEREILDSEWRELGSKEAALRKNFIQFHKFVKENKEKKERARRRIEEEELIHEKRDEDIEIITDKINKLKAVCVSLEYSVKSLKMYEDYLKGVLSITPEYNSIMSFLNRYDALSSARNDLVAKQKLGLEELEKARISMMELVEERVGVLMGINNQLAELQVRFEKAKHVCRYWENVVYKVKSKSANELLNIYIIKDSIWNLYGLMCLRKGTPAEIKKKDYENQLTFIKGTIQEYKRIVKIASKKTSKDASSVQTDSGKSVAS